VFRALLVFLTLTGLHPAMADGLNVTRAWVSDGEGRAQDRFYVRGAAPVDPGIFFHVRLGGRDSARHVLYVVPTGPGGREVGRFGGSFSGASIGGTGADFPAACDPDGANGFAIDETVATRPGRYKARVFLDGAVVDELPFEVVALQGNGGVRLTEAHLEDRQGYRRDAFTDADRGVYVRVSLINESRNAPHEHLVQVLWEGRQGAVGRVMGGVLRVAEGARLDGLELPAACDPRGEDGVLLRGLPPGDYLVKVAIDGTVRARLRFRLTAEKKTVRKPKA